MPTLFAIAAASRMSSAVISLWMFSRIVGEPDSTPSESRWQVPRTSSSEPGAQVIAPSGGMLGTPGVGGAPNGAKGEATPSKTAP